MSEPLARGAIVTVGRARAAPLAALAKEATAILKALSAEATARPSAGATEDFVLLLVDEGTDPESIELPDLKDRAASALAIAEDAPLGRAAVARARRRLRAAGATLGARELVLAPSSFGHLGLESDGLREKLEILLRALVVDAERLRLRREGWEEPDERPST
ncbi:MAG TPA: hypothetical protein VM370_05635 [Candidatus Thermoplasmatota archaeon]|nr:hypothetical protein [Candidatus Thermoplasmatota archaeon]